MGLGGFKVKPLQIPKEKKTVRSPPASDHKYVSDM